MKTESDFQIATAKIKPVKWIIHHCSMCNYPCGYVFTMDYKHVGYDSGCHCVTYENITPCPWSALAEHYNMQRNPEVIKEMNEFWGFPNET